MSNKYEEYDVVQVHWVDSSGFDGTWIDNYELEFLKPKNITTVGHLVKDSDDYVVVAPTIGDEQNFGSLCIPYCAIRTMKRILTLSRSLKNLKESRDDVSHFSK